MWAMKALLKKSFKAIAYVGTFILLLSVTSGIYNFLNRPDEITKSQYEEVIRIATTCTAADDIIKHGMKKKRINIKEYELIMEKCGPE